ncbi:hypothetical protein [Pseudarthrobacter psychrotolerans]|uniref:Ig-like domain-containing protein n=1 Tax=Pseudarthrobacter psychrotolerans TaxID=2697569 RepID=A0A6P1NYA9_9MICC|nr:hypothetical protein [Pseudarthrobacter psychrotolerans]QHK22622.1 hypothetical protein GU243_23975 [Pseudarthrobacter psychrotolerans]
MKRRYLAGAGLLVMAAALTIAPPRQSLASWTYPQYGSGSFTAGTVAPATSLACTAGVLSPPKFTWTAPTGGLTRGGYAWTVTATTTGGPSGNGTLAPSATSVTLPSGILSIGSGTFSLTATGPGGWTSIPVTGTVSAFTGLVYSCSVP